GPHLRNRAARHRPAGAVTVSPADDLSPFARSLLEAAPDARGGLIARCPPAQAAAEAADLAEHARRVARAQPGESQRYAELAWALAETHGPDRVRAVALRARAVALWAQGRSAEALAAAEQGAALAAEDPLLAAQVPILAVELLAQLGR